MKKLVELGFIIKEMPELFVVHPRNDAVGDAARNLRRALRVVQAVHLRDLIIDIACVVFGGALGHIGHQPDAAFARLFVQHIGSFKHCAVIHLTGALERIGQLSHD